MMVRVPVHPPVSLLSAVSLWGIFYFFTSTNFGAITNFCAHSLPNLPRAGRPTFEPVSFNLLSFTHTRHRPVYVKASGALNEL